MARTLTRPPSRASTKWSTASIAIPIPPLAELVDKGLTIVSATRRGVSFVVSLPVRDGRVTRADVLGTRESD